MKYSNCFYSIPTRWRKLPDDVLSIVVSYMPNKHWFNNMIQKSIEKWECTMTTILFNRAGVIHYLIYNEIRTSPFKAMRFEFYTYDLGTTFSYRYYNSEYDGLGGTIEWKFDSKYMLTTYVIEGIKHHFILLKKNNKYKWSFNNDSLTYWDDNNNKRCVQIKEDNCGHYNLYILPM